MISYIIKDDYPNLNFILSLIYSEVILFHIFEFQLSVKTM